jgi:hypothetical protein
MNLCLYFISHFSYSLQLLKHHRYQLPTMSVSRTFMAVLENAGYLSKTCYMCEHIGLKGRRYLLFQIVQHGR